MNDPRVVMLGLGGPTFITDWAKAVARFSSVAGLSVVTRIPSNAEPLTRGLAIGDVAGFTTVYVRRRRLRPVRLFWKLNARTEATAMQRAIQAMGWSPDMIHGHFFAGAAAVPTVAERLGIPFVLTEHTSRLAAPDAENHLSRQGIRIMKMVFASAATVFFVGEEQLTSAHRLGATGNFDVIPNPVDTGLFTPKPDATTTPRIVTIGHLLARKRHHLLLRAMRHVLTRIPDAHLEILGGGDQAAALERLAAELEITSAVTFHGATDRRIISELLQQSALYAHVSERESFGVAIIEALLSGTPAVAVRCGGVSEELVPEVGITIDGADPVVIAEAIIAALTSRRFAGPAEIAEWASQRYGSDAVAAAVQKHYDEILGSS